ncbi:MAG: hypothetical protein AAF591_13325 [Verrucomicrobiota bacterium]
MKLIAKFPALLAALGLLTYGCDKHHDHDHPHDDDHGEHHGHGEEDESHADDHDDHEGHDDDGEKHDGDEHAEHSHDHGHDHDHDHDHDHEHSPHEAGPNGGRLFYSVEPHAEFLVTEDRKVQITFVDENDKLVPVAEQTVSVIAGDRSNPTKLAFAKSGDVLISDGPLPDGNNFPAVVQIKPAPNAKTVIERLNVNLSDCPSCDYQEYACTCGHTHD